MLHAVAPMEATMLSIGRVVLALAFLISAPMIAVAQTSEPGNSPPAVQSQPGDQLLKPEQLEALAAPIALYPDDFWRTCWRHRLIRWKWCRPTAG